MPCVSIFLGIQTSLFINRLSHYQMYEQQCKVHGYVRQIVNMKLRGSVSYKLLSASCKYNKIWKGAPYNRYCLSSYFASVLSQFAVSVDGVGGSFPLLALPPSPRVDDHWRRRRLKRERRSTVQTLSGLRDT